MKEILNHGKYRHWNLFFSSKDENNVLSKVMEKMSIDYENLKKGVWKSKMPKRWQNQSSEKYSQSFGIRKWAAFGREKDDCKRQCKCKKCIGTKSCKDWKRFSNSERSVVCIFWRKNTFVGSFWKIGKWENKHHATAFSSGKRAWFGQNTG